MQPKKYAYMQNFRGHSKFLLQSVIIPLTGRLRFMKEKHIFFVAETKGTMESLELRPIEQAKISCAKKLFNEMSTSKVRYHDVDSYQNLLAVINSIK